MTRASCSKWIIRALAALSKDGDAQRTCEPFALPCPHWLDTSWELDSSPSTSLGLSGSLVWGQSYTRNFTEESRRAGSVLSPAFTELIKLRLGLCATPQQRGDRPPALPLACSSTHSQKDFRRECVIGAVLRLKEGLLSSLNYFWVTEREMRPRILVLNVSVKQQALLARQVHCRWSHFQYQHKRLEFVTSRYKG